MYRLSSIHETYIIFYTFTQTSVNVSWAFPCLTFRVAKIKCKCNGGCFTTGSPRLITVQSCDRPSPKSYLRLNFRIHMHTTWSHMTIFWFLGNQPTFMASCSISHGCDLWHLCVLNGILIATGTTTGAWKSWNKNLPQVLIFTNRYACVLAAGHISQNTYTDFLQWKI